MISEAKGPVQGVHHQASDWVRSEYTGWYAGRKKHTNVPEAVRRFV
jgi:hypothetical protein